MKHPLFSDEPAERMARQVFLDGLYPILLGLALVVILFALAGCCSPRTVTVPGETPPPTVVTETDTVYLASPPDTVFAPPETLRVVETVPVEVTRYRDARPDTSRAYLLWQLSVDSARVAISGAAADASYRRPVPGERLRCVAAGPSTLDCRLEGEPSEPPARRFECPACPDVLLHANLRGWLTLLGALFMAAAFGATAVAVLKS